MRGSVLVRSNNSNNVYSSKKQPNNSFYFTVARVTTVRLPDRILIDIQSRRYWEVSWYSRTSICMSIWWAFKEKLWKITSGMCRKALDNVSPKWNLGKYYFSRLQKLCPWSAWKDILRTKRDEVLQHGINTEVFPWDHVWYQWNVFCYVDIRVENLSSKIYSNVRDQPSHIICNPRGSRGRRESYFWILVKGYKREKKLSHFCEYLYSSK